VKLATQCHVDAWHGPGGLCTALKQVEERSQVGPQIMTFRMPSSPKSLMWRSVDAWQNSTGGSSDNDVPNAFEPKVFDVEIGLLHSAAMWHVFAFGCEACLVE